MSLSPRAVVFDMDGLLIDSEPLYRRAWGLAAGDLRYAFPDHLYDRFYGRSFDDCMEMIRAEIDPDFPVEAFRAACRLRSAEEQARTGFPLKPGAEEIVLAVKSLGLPAAVATMTKRADAFRALGILADHLSVLTGGDEVPRGKPEPDIYLETFRRLDVQPGEVVALEDSAPGARAALASGAAVIVVPDILPPPPDVAARALAVVPSLSEARRLLEHLHAPLPH